MKEIIKGIVKENPKEFEKCCIYSLEQEDGDYLVLSTDKQACKDSVFISKGQEIAVKGIMLAEKARINTNGFLKMEDE